jgi:hypothetical protein
MGALGLGVVFSSIAYAEAPFTTCLIFRAERRLSFLERIRAPEALAAGDLE